MLLLRLYIRGMYRRAHGMRSTACTKTGLCPDSPGLRLSGGRCLSVVSGVSSIAGQFVDLAVQSCTAAAARNSSRSMPRPSRNAGDQEPPAHVRRLAKATRTWIPMVSGTLDPTLGSEAQFA